jgi:dUTP pyrophosphatase
VGCAQGLHLPSGLLSADGLASDVRLRVSRVDPTLPLPSYASAGAAGLDLYCREDVTIQPGSLGFIPANVIVAVPDGFMLLVALRSGTPRRTGLISPHGMGIIDRDYRGPDDEIRIQVFNPTAMAVTVGRGDRVAQALLVPVARVEWDEGDPASESSRGGFGSTG